MTYQDGLDIELDFSVSKCPGGEVNTELLSNVAGAIVDSVRSFCDGYGDSVPENATYKVHGVRVKIKRKNTITGVSN